MSGLFLKIVYMNLEKKIGPSVLFSELNFQILEPREQLSFRDNTKHNEVLNYNNGDYFPALSYVTPLHTIDKREHDEVRKPMIIKQLNQLTQKRFEIIQDNANLSVDNKKSMEDESPDTCTER